MVAAVQTVPRILLVEDDEFDAERMERKLRKVRPELRVETAWDGKEALERLESMGTGRLPLILLDLHMPRMDGIDFLAHLRRKDPWSRAVVFVLTTSDHERDRRAAYDHNVAGYFLKDEPADQIGDLVDRYIELSRLP